MKIFVRSRHFYKTLAVLAVPIALQSMITVGVNMTDNIMLGTLGEVKMSGATLANNFISIFSVLLYGVWHGRQCFDQPFLGNEKYG